MAISDYLLNYPQAPKLKTNYAANALQNLQQSGNPFAGLVGAFLSPLSAKTDRDNARALQQYSQEAGLAQTLMNWGRQDALDQRNRDWALQDAQTERENKLADALAQYQREDAVAQRNREWGLSDALRQYKREDDVASRQRNWVLDDRKALWEREDALTQKKDEAEQMKKQELSEQSRDVALRGLAELQGIADRDSIGALTRFGNSIGFIKDKTRQDLGKISGAVAAIAPMAIDRLKSAGVSGINSLPEFLTYVGLPENPTSQEIAGALPIIRQTLGLEPTQTDKSKLDGYNKKYGL